jgi:hypothetical protein
MKISSDTIGNRTRNLLALSTVPQPTAPPHTLLKHVGVINTMYTSFQCNTTFII